MHCDKAVSREGKAFVRNWVVLSEADDTIIPARSDGGRGGLGAVHCAAVRLLRFFTPRKKAAMTAKAWRFWRRCYDLMDRAGVE